MSGRKTAALGNEAKRIKQAWADDAAIDRIRRQEREALERIAELDADPSTHNIADPTKCAVCMARAALEAKEDLTNERNAK